jgi:hypothetical protein
MQYQLTELQRKLREYNSLFNHPVPSEVLRFEPEIEILDKINQAIASQRPVVEWMERSSLQTGTVFDLKYQI